VVCGLAFAKRVHLRDHLSVDHNHHHHPNDEGASVNYSTTTALRSELVDSATNTATVSSDILQNTINSKQLQLMTKKTSKETLGTNLLNMSHFNLVENRATNSTNALIDDLIHCPDYLSKNLALLLSSSNYSSAAVGISPAKLPRIDATPALQSFVPFVQQLIPSDSIGREANETTCDPSPSLSTNLSTSVLAAYLARLQTMQNQLMISRATSQNSLLNTNQETTGHTPICVKQEPQEIDTSYDERCILGQSYTTLVKQFSSEAFGGEQVFDYSFKSSASDSRGDDQNACDTPVDLSFRGAVTGNICVKNELDAGEYFRREDALNLESDKHRNNTEVSGTTNGISRFENAYHDSRLFKIEESNSNGRQAEYSGAIRPTSTKKAKKGLSNMVEKLWKNKMIDSSKYKADEIGNEQMTTGETEEVKMAEGSSELVSLESVSVPLPQTSSGVSCTMQFRACPVCRQLFDNSKEMWDHALTHPAYKNRHTWKKKKNNRKQHTKERLDRVEQYMYLTSQTALPEPEIKMDISMASGSLSSSLICELFRCAYPDCGKLFKEKCHLKTHEKNHTEVQLIHCTLCPYSCHHQHLMKHHMAGKHVPDKYVVTDNQLGHFGESYQIFRHDECLHNLVSEDTHMMSVSTEVFPIEATVHKDEGSQYEGTNEDMSDRMIGAWPMVNEDIFNRMSDETDTRLKYVDGHRTEATERIWQVQSCCTNNAFSSGNTEQTADNKISSNQMVNFTEKPNTKLLLRRVTPAPGSDPQFYTSLMKITYGKSSLPQPTTNEGLVETLPTISVSERPSDVVCSGPSFDLVNSSILKSITKFDCDTCDFPVQCTNGLRNHLLSTHGTEMDDVKDTACFECHKAYSTRSGLKQHLQRCHGVEGDDALYVCPRAACAVKHHSKGSALKNHVRHVVHLAGDPKLTCLHDGCARKFESEATLLTHLMAHSQERPLVCGYNGCDKAFRELKHLKVHQMQHTDLKPLRCEMCEYSCRQRNSMNWHMKSQHGLEKHVTSDGRTMYA